LKNYVLGCHVSVNKISSYAGGNYFGFILICLYFMTGHFHTPMYFAKNVAYFPFNSWLSFQRLCRLIFGFVNEAPHSYT